MTKDGLSINRVKSDPVCAGSLWQIIMPQSPITHWAAYAERYALMKTFHILKGINHMKNAIALILGSIVASNANSWEFTQTTINHISTSNDDYFYISVGQQIDTNSGCSQAWGMKNWLGFKIDPTDQTQKTIISLATAAYMAGKTVDVGSSVVGCLVDKPVPHLGYIRIGNYR